MFRRKKVKKVVVQSSFWIHHQRNKVYVVVTFPRAYPLPLLTAVHCKAFVSKASFSRGLHLARFTKGHPKGGEENVVALNTKESVFCHMFSSLLDIIGRLTLSGEGQLMSTPHACAS